jgi:hypothetical protein
MIAISMQFFCRLYLRASPPLTRPHMTRHWLTALAVLSAAGVALVRGGVLRLGRGAVRGSRTETGAKKYSESAVRQLGICGGRCTFSADGDLVERRGPRAGLFGALAIMSGIGLLKPAEPITAA